MNISFEEFKKIDLRAAKILAAEKVAGSEKLIKLQITLGDEERQVVAGIAQFYQPENLVGREIIVVANLEPRKLMGLESQGMLLAADDNGQPVLLNLDREVPPGSVVK